MTINKRILFNVEHRAFKSNLTGREHYGAHSGRTRPLRHFPLAFGWLLQCMMSLSRASRFIR